MSISENQLEIWSHQGATDSAQNTHQAIRRALEKHVWRDGVTYNPYLQGSYANHTNTYGNSDVDLVVELTSVFYNDLTEAQKSFLNITKATYGIDDFRADVIVALTDYFGSQNVDISGGKSVKILPNGNRLKGDVVIAATYRHYDGTKLIAEGIVFWNTKTGAKIINYPKLHLDNGATKNANTSQRYKPTVRIFKNARKRIYENKPLLANRFPSYYVECLLYNVQNSQFSASRQDTYCNVVNWLNSELNTNSSRFKCQNGLIPLFGNDSTQWNVADAKLLVSELISLWNS
ncbi:MAG: nucleotidyltransferase [Chloroflexi bacterium]|nr:nucleotidyltransferase [Chloroflexota bacterium]